MQVNAIARDQCGEVRPEPDALEVATEYQLQLVARYDLEDLELDARAAGIESENHVAHARLPAWPRCSAK